MRFTPDDEQQAWIAEVREFGIDSNGPYADQFLLIRQRGSMETSSCVRA